MQIVRDPEQGLFTFIPTDAAEQIMLKYTAATLNPNDEIVYRGRTTGDDDKSSSLQFQIGGTPVTRSPKNATIVGYHGGMEFVLKPDTDEDREEIFCVRDMCYFGGGVLRFLNIVELDGKQVIAMTGKSCRQCDHNMITPRECHTDICDACAAECVHSFDIEGMLLGGESNLSVGTGCSKCGRVKPSAEGEREKTPLEKHLDVERKLGITVIYKDGPPSAPKKAVEMNRIIRGHGKAQQRQQH